jgi:hypothetical protein
VSPQELYSRILPYVPGCPEPTVDLAVIEAATEFAEKTQLSFFMEAPISLVDGTSTYYIAPDYEVEVDLITGVFCAGRELKHVTPSSLHDQAPDWETSESNEPTHYSTFGDAGSITVYPKPMNTTGQAIRVFASWVPSFDATSIPDELGRTYARDIVEGAKARLMMIPDRKWTNLQLAGIAQGKFDSAIVDGRIKAIHNSAASTITARPQRFGGS